MPLSTTRVPAGKIVDTTQQDDTFENDAEVIAYFEAQRKSARSAEWIACLDATIRQLRHGIKLPS